MKIMRTANFYKVCFCRKIYQFIPCNYNLFFSCIFVINCDFSNIFFTIEVFYFEFLPPKVAVLPIVDLEKAQRKPSFTYNWSINLTENELKSNKDLNKLKKTVIIKK